MCIAVSSHAAVTLQNWSSAPWSAVGGVTSFSGAVTDPDFESGTSATFTFSSPLSGIGITDPSAPDFSTASSSVFGFEGTGFGVSETTVGRFNCGESFILQANHAFQLNSIRWAEYTGDEILNISWVSGGVAMSQMVYCSTNSFFTVTTFTGITVDANTSLEIVNVSPTSAYAAGRLRVNWIDVSLTEETEEEEEDPQPVVTPTVGETHTLSGWTVAPWSASTGVTSFSADIADDDFGTATFTFCDPLISVGITDPDAPDFSSSVASYFGFEGTGFGVGNTTVGRFDRGESFVLTSTKSFELQAILWLEYSGDETVHISWISGGVPMNQTIVCGAGGFSTLMDFTNILVDANTDLKITNVSDTSAGASGRLRINLVDVALTGAVEEEEEDPVDPSAYPEYAGSMIVLNNWSLWPWNAVIGVTSFNSGTMTAPENGGTVSTMTFADPLTGVDITDPSSPDFSTSAASYFGFESTGFGVGDSTTGRFNRGESFSITCAHDFRLEEMSWREVDGVELIHISWTHAGVPQSMVVTLTTAKILLTDVMADANTPVVFTNVSQTDERVRIEYLTTALMYDVAPSYDFSGSDGFVQMFGVNLAGAEFGGYAFWPTETAQWTYYHSKGLNLMRIPFLWERIQPTLYGTVDTSNLDAIVALATANGMKVILDMHNYDRYNGSVIGTTTVPNAAFQDVWRKLAAHYAGNSAIYGYGLMNEPHDTGGLWPASAQAATDAIREVDSSTWIIVAGDNWSGSYSWPTSNPNLDISDSSDKIMYEAHCYFDSNSDGVYGSYDGEAPVWNVGPLRIAPFATWLQKMGARGFIGEYGIPDNDVRWNTILDTFMSYLSANGLSGTYWAGGMHWGSYILDCSPSDNYTVDAPQMEVLEDYAD